MEETQLKLQMVLILQDTMELVSFLMVLQASLQHYLDTGISQLEILWKKLVGTVGSQNFLIHPMNHIDVLRSRFYQTRIILKLILLMGMVMRLAVNLNHRAPLMAD